MSNVYATLNDLILALPRGEAELIELTDTVGSGSVDEDKINRKLADAGSTIDSYLRSRYPLPLLAVPELLRNAACDLARYALYGDAAPKEVKDRHDAAISLLKDLAAGRATLPPEVVEGQGGQPVSPARAIRHGQARSNFDWRSYP